MFNNIGQAWEVFKQAHLNSDTDNEASSIHHTLGGSPHQAAPGNHNHDGDYSAITHDHDADYSATTHNHDADYSATTHNHDADYEPLVSDSGWLTTGMTAGTNFTITGTRYRKIGNQTQLDVVGVIGISKSPGANGNIGNETILTMPSGYRPTQLVMAPGRGGSEYLAVSHLNTDGTLVLTAVSGGVSSVAINDTFYFTLGYLVD